MNQTLWCPKKSRNQNVSACITCGQSFTEPICIEYAKLTGTKIETKKGEGKMSKDKKEVKGKNEVETKIVDTVTDKEAIKERQSAGIAKSWLNPATAAARKERHSVTVNKETYGSVRKAFTALGLPDNKHIKFRGQLKKEGKMTFKHLNAEGKEESFLFTCTKIEKLKAEAKK